MKLQITVKPNAKEDRIEKLDEERFHLSVKEPPVQGRANRAVLRALAEYFGVSQNQISIVSGFTSRNKIVEIE